MSTDLEWERWGARDPYFGVITHPRFRSDTLTQETKDEFFASGTSHVAYVLDMCRLYIDPIFAPQRVLDFGCGVGRVLVPLAKLACDVVGMDVSPSMLAEARRNCDEREARQVTLVLSDDTLSAVAGQFDLVHSSIVLQHIEVERGRALFSQLTARVKPGGIGALHVTFGWDVFADNFGRPPARPIAPPPPKDALSQARTHVKRLLDLRGEPPAPAPVEPAGDPEMQMNYYNLSELMFILQRHGVRRVHTEFTDHGGAIGVFIFFQRPL